MTGTFASRAFLMRAAIFGTDVTQVGRGGQITDVMSSTRSAAPFTGTSTATGSGIFGMGDVGVGAAVGAGVAAGALVATASDIGEADGAAAGAVHVVANASSAIAMNERRMASSPATGSGSTPAS